MPLITSVQFGCSVVSDSLQPCGLQHARIPCSSPTRRACSNSCTIQPFYSLPSPSLPAFHLCQHQGLSQGASLCIRWPIYWSFSFSITPSNNIQDWFPLGWTGWISLQSKWLSRVFSNTTVQSTISFVLSLLYSPNLTSMTTGKTIALTKGSLMAK